MRPMRQEARIGYAGRLVCAAALAAALPAGVAAADPAPAAAPAPAQADWRAVATSGDHDRLRRWREAWTAALKQVEAAGETDQLAAYPALTTPDTALADPAPPPGTYRCRTFKLGSQGDLGLAFVDYPAFTCRIRRVDGMLHFAKLTGSQRPSGLLYPDTERRLVFLGTMALGDETRASPYGRDAERDMAGIFERTGPRSWRLVLPFPRWESILDVIELTAS